MGLWLHFCHHDSLNPDRGDASILQHDVAPVMRLILSIAPAGRCIHRVGVARTACVPIPDTSSRTLSHVLSHAYYDRL
jgi:hypothetical protein